MHLDKATCLTLGDNYNLPIGCGVLPVGLKEIKFGSQFNQPLISGSLPNTLENIEFGQDFNQELEQNVLPLNLKRLFLGSHYGFKIHSVNLPPYLTHIGWSSSPSSATDSPLPGLFRSFSSTELPECIPTSITHLNLGNGYSEPIHPGTLHEGLISLQLGYNFNQPLQLGSLPSTLINLELGTCFDQPFPIGSLPANLESLTVSHSFQTLIMPAALPRSLTRMKFKVSAYDGHNLLVHNISTLLQHGATVELQIYTNKVYYRTYFSTFRLINKLTILCVEPDQVYFLHLHKITKYLSQKSPNLLSLGDNKHTKHVYPPLCHTS
eukprot:gene8959-10507_t